METTSWEDQPSYLSLSPLLITVPREEEFKEFNQKKECNKKSRIHLKAGFQHETHTCNFIRGCLVKQTQNISYTLVRELYQPQPLTNSLILKFLCDVMTYHAAKVAAHKDMVERGQLQVGGPQVPGQLQTFTVRHAAAPVRRTQRACARRAVIWTHRGEFNCTMRGKVGF